MGATEGGGSSKCALQTEFQGAVGGSRGVVWCTTQALVALQGEMANAHHSRPLVCLTVCWLQISAATLFRYVQTYLLA